MKKTTDFGFKEIDISGRDNLQKSEVLLARGVLAMLRCGIMEGAVLTNENLAVTGVTQDEEFALKSYIEQSGLGLRVIAHGTNTFRAAPALYRLIAKDQDTTKVNLRSLLIDVALDEKSYASVAPLSAGLMGYLS